MRKGCVIFVGAVYAIVAEYRQWVAASVVSKCGVRGVEAVSGIISTKISDRVY
jgi:hypothetical protein